MKEERESGVSGQPWGPDEKHRAHWRTRHKPPGLYPQTRLHLCPSQLRNSVGTQDGEGGDHGLVPPLRRAPGVPSCRLVHWRVGASLPCRQCPLTHLTRAPGCPRARWKPGCSLHLALVPRAVWRRAGQLWGLFGTFPGSGRRLALPPTSARGPHGPQRRPRALAGSGGFYCANAVARGSAHLWSKRHPAIRRLAREGPGGERGHP